MPTLRVFIANLTAPSPLAAAAVRHAQAAAGRCSGRAQVEVISLDDPIAEELGVVLEPTVLVDDLVVAVGQAPPAGHLLRAIEAASERE